MIAVCVEWKPETMPQATVTKKIGRSGQMSNVEKKLQSSTQGVGAQTPTGAKTEYPEMFINFFDFDAHKPKDTGINCHVEALKDAVVKASIILAGGDVRDDIEKKYLNDIIIITSLAYRDLAELEKENLEHCFCGKGGVICD